MEASSNGDVKCVQLLLDRGAQIDHQNKVNAIRHPTTCLFIHVMLRVHNIIKHTRPCRVMW